MSRYPLQTCVGPLGSSSTTLLSPLQTLNWPLIMFLWIVVLALLGKFVPSIFGASRLGSFTPVQNLTSRKEEAVTTDYEDDGFLMNVEGTRSAPLWSPALPSLVRNSSRSETPSLIRGLEIEACSKAKEAGKHPSYSKLVLTLVYHYGLNINLPVLSNGLSIFHCSCLSGSLKLVSALAPLANIHQTTQHGDSPLYLAVYAAGYRARTGAGSQAGLEVVEFLLKAGCRPNHPNLAGFTALHQASRLGHLALVTLLLNWRADTEAGLSAASLQYSRNMDLNVALDG